MTAHAVVIWIITGLLAGVLAGLIARLISRRRAHHGLIADLTAGWLGAALAGWLLRKLPLWQPVSLVDHGFVALFGAILMLVLLRLFWFLGAKWRRARRLPPAAADAGLDAQLRRATDFEPGLLSRFLRRKPASQDVNQTFDAQLTFGERVADQVAAFGGSWVFIGLFFAAMISWMALNEDLAKPFDPYPFILLNLVLSCLAAVQAPVIMMSQNRQTAKDRLEAHNAFEVNLRAEVEIMALHDKLEAMRVKELREVVQLLEEQMQRLSALEQAVRPVPSAGQPPSGPNQVP